MLMGLAVMIGWKLPMQLSRNQYEKKWCFGIHLLADFGILIIQSTQLKVISVDSFLSLRTCSFAKWSFLGNGRSWFCNDLLLQGVGGQRLEEKKSYRGIGENMQEGNANRVNMIYPIFPIKYQKAIVWVWLDRFFLTCDSRLWKEKSEATERNTQSW